jgi:hypothetical protein
MLLFSLLLCKNLYFDGYLVGSIFFDFPEIYVAGNMSELGSFLSYFMQKSDEPLHYFQSCMLLPSTHWVCPLWNLFISDKLSFSLIEVEVNRHGKLLPFGVC